MQIRKATLDDSLQLSSLCLNVQRLHSEHHPRIFKKPETADFAVSFFEEMLQDESVFAFIATENGKGIGYVLAKLVERPENPFTFPRRYLMIDQISIHPSEQGRGVGAALIKKVGTLAQEMEIQKIQLDSWDFNTKAHEFFRKQGFHEYHFRFWREV
jgi:ribosomal protein S18 acetylase RimI-like enzyme